MASLRPRWKFFDLQWTNERRDSSPIGLVELPQVLQVLHALLQHIHVQASSLKAAGTVLPQASLSSNASWTFEQNWKPFTGKLKSYFFRGPR